MKNAPLKVVLWCYPLNRFDLFLAPPEINAPGLAVNWPINAPENPAQIPARA
jgi:hypothetical protein